MVEKTPEEWICQIMVMGTRILEVMDGSAATREPFVVCGRIEEYLVIAGWWTGGWVGVLRSSLESSKGVSPATPTID